MSQLAHSSAPVNNFAPAPIILKYPVVAQRLTSLTIEPVAEPRQSTVDRARLEHHNKCCPNCRRVTVQLVELDNALLDRRGLAIPSTASIAGFYCTSCRHEWTPGRLQLVCAE
jgi:hypothetical protein